MADYIVHKAVELDALSTKTKAKLEECNHWIVSPKYDGCHAILLFKDGNFVGALSRTGEKVYSLDHIGQSFEDNYRLPLGQVAICGEAWIPGQEFNEISGHFRRQSGRITELYFVPFDFVGWDCKNSQESPVLYSEGGYLDRLLELASYQTSPVIPGRIITPQFFQEIGSLSSVIDSTKGYARFLKASNLGAYDGAIVARADGKYNVGAGKGGEFIKVKPTLSFTVTVTGAEIARGEKTGKNTAALLFELDDKTQRVSTGLTQAQVDQITAETMGLHYGSMKHEWHGCRIEVGAMGKTINGYLREPRFLGVRTDA